MREFCPECRTVRNVVKTISKTSMTDADGSPIILCTAILHCEKCGSYVRKKSWREKNGKKTR
jgi:hypothetical protein